MWLIRGLTPDFKTIADFRKDNRDAFKPVFRQFVLLCRRLELFGGELQAVDGTRPKAVNSAERNFTHAKLTKLLGWIDQKLTEYLDRLDRCDEQEEDESISSLRLKRRAWKHMSPVHSVALQCERDFFARRNSSTTHERTSIAAQAISPFIGHHQGRRDLRESMGC
jgi:hypothetical protein